VSYIGKAPGFGIRNRYLYTATASQTTFSGADDNGQTLAYADSKYLDVYLNGVLLVAGTDYTATTLTSVTLTSGASASDIVEIVAYDIFSVADTVSAKNGGTFNGDITIDGDLTASSLAYPTTDGSAGQFLKTDGSGTLSFDTVAVTPAAVSGQANTATDYFALPAGTTAQRPGTPAEGYTRYNTDDDKIEVYADGNWETVTSSTFYTIEYLIVAGGGSGGSGQGGSWGSGGGGAGGAVDSSGTVAGGTAYTVTVGAGAAQQTSNPGTGNTGSNSSIAGIQATTALGGGGGGADFGPTSTPGQPGGSGGGGASGAQGGGSGTSGQGNNGGAGAAGGGGGGGGASQVGEAGNTDGANQGGDGGNGINWKSLGTTYAGGGGGGSYAGATNGTGGTGGGGAGGGVAGTANTGGGGGGAASGANDGGAGGSGVVIIRYQSGTQLGTGGTVTSSGGYYYHTFNSSGTFTA